MREGSEDRLSFSHPDKMNTYIPLRKDMAVYIWVSMKVSVCLGKKLEALAASDRNFLNILDGASL